MPASLCQKTDRAVCRRRPGSGAATFYFSPFSCSCASMLIGTRYREQNSLHFWVARKISHSLHTLCHFNIRDALFSVSLDSLLLWFGCVLVFILGRWKKQFNISFLRLWVKVCHVWLTAGENPRRVLHVFLWAAAEHFGAGRASVPGFNPAENFSSGFILCHHRNRHQHARSPAGERTLLEVVKIIKWLLFQAVGLWC